MDSAAPKTGVSQEIARESLMAISQATSEKYLTAKKTGSESATVREDNKEAEKYRSALISISYTESPDARPSPPST